MDWVKVFSSIDVIKSEIVKTMLIEQGIPAIMMNKQDSAYVVIGDIELMVPSDYADEAFLLITSLTFDEE